MKGTSSLTAASDQSPKVMVEKNGKLENEKTPKWQLRRPTLSQLS